MIDNKRRSFLKNAFLSVSILTIPSPLLSATKKITSISGDKKLLKLKAQNLFYNGMYSSSESLYLKLIKQYPSDITIYDGLSKVFLSQFKITNRIELFKKALALNPANHLFYDRYAQALKCLSSGYQNIEKEYYNSKDYPLAIHEAIHIYSSAIDKFPNKQYLCESLLDCERSLDVINKRLIKKGLQTYALDQNTIDDISIKTDRIKMNWVTDRQSRKRRNESFDIKQAEIKLALVDSKKRKALSNPKGIKSREANLLKEKKYILTNAFMNQYALGNSKNCLMLFQKIRSIDSRETSTKGLLLKLYYKRKEYRQIIEFYEQQNSKEIWSIIGLAKVYMKSGSKELTLKANSLLLNVINKESHVPALHKGIVGYGYAKSYLKQGKFEESRNAIIKILSETGFMGASSTLIVLYAESYLKENKDHAVLLLTSYANLQRISEEVDDPIKYYINAYVENMNMSALIKRHPGNSIKAKMKDIDMNSKSALPVLSALARIYKKDKNTSMYDIVQDRIEALSN